VNAIGEQQLRSETQREAGAEVDTIGEQQIFSDRCQLASCAFTPWQMPIGITAMVELYYIPRLIATMVYMY